MRVRIRKVLFWVTVIPLALLAAALGFAYSYVTDGATLANIIRREVPRFLPNTVIQMGRVQWRPFLGQVTLQNVYLWQSVDGRPFAAAQVAWLNVRCDLGALTRGKVVATEVSIAQPKLRLRRRRDGSWNIQGLVADPWPAPPLPSEPTILIKNGTVELCDETGDAPVMVLRDVELTLTPGAEVGGELQFEGSARGGPFDSLRRLDGTLDRRTGRIKLRSGDLTRLELTDTFRDCLPDAVRTRFEALGLSGGEVNVSIQGLEFDPNSADPLRTAAVIEVRGAALERPELPFPLTGASALARLENDTLTIEHAEGRNGKTLVQLQGAIAVDDPADGPLKLRVEVSDLELDERLERVTPAEFRMLWGEYQAKGWINAALDLNRPRAAAPIDFRLVVHCQDVGLKYEHFPYPVQHMQGTLVWKGERVAADLRTLIGGQLVTCKGTIDNPGAAAIVDLDFEGAAFPIDETLFRALPPEFHKVVTDFQPTGSVRGVAHLHRVPPISPEDPPIGRVRIHAELDLNKGCSMRWAGLPYLIQNLTGHLDLNPERSTFTNMRGRNGPAEISANGEVKRTGPNQEDVEITLVAEHLPFEQQLHDALPAQWQATWATLNPHGKSHVEARITGRSGQEPHYHLKIVPEPAETRVRLVLTPIEENVAPRTIALPPMENVAGTFIYDDGTITMDKVSCSFREAPVRFQWGNVVLQPNGGFRLMVRDLEVAKLRLDSELRKIMPQVMAQFAQRLDDGKTFGIRSDLGIGWNGQPGVPARCEWDKATVVFDGNTIQSGLPLGQLQGQIDHVRGWSDGRGIDLSGVVAIDSMFVAGQQLTALRSPLVVENGEARLSSIEAKILGGTIYGAARLSLEETPRYVANLQLQNADLARYTMTIPGKQSLRGLLSAKVAVEGRGNDMRTCVGEAEASITEGDLGELPLALRWVKAANLRPLSKTAFDAAELHATISDGRAAFDTIAFRGDAFSLFGSGTVELQGDRELDLRLTPHYGRDERRIPLVGDALREVSSRAVALHVTGPLSSPAIRPEPLPDFVTPLGEYMRRLGERRAARSGREPR